MLGLFTIVSWILVACCSRLDLTYVIRVRVAVLLRPICSSHLKRSLPIRSTSVRSIVPFQRAVSIKFDALGPSGLPSVRSDPLSDRSNMNGLIDRACLWFYRDV